MPLRTALAAIEPDDAALVAATARRDAAAFARLVDRHVSSVHRLAYRMLGDASEAEDIAQETFVRLWDHAGSWRPQGGGLPAWLRRIATNLCLDRLRRRARLSDGPVPDLADERPTADATIACEQLNTLAAGIVQSLPGRQRAAIVLTYYEDQPNAVAADILEMNVKAFESLLARARAALRARLGGLGITADDLGAVR